MNRVALLYYFLFTQKVKYVHCSLKPRLCVFVHMCECAFMHILTNLYSFTRVHARTHAHTHTQLHTPQWTGALCWIPKSSSRECEALSTAPLQLSNRSEWLPSARPVASIHHVDQQQWRHLGHFFLSFVVSITRCFDLNSQSHSHAEVGKLPYGRFVLSICNIWKCTIVNETWQTMKSTV